MLISVNTKQRKTA